jgi:hypothetical protein
MLRITGYSDKYSVCPGDEVKFYVNSEKNEAFNADIVRLIHGDTNPEGPGFKEKLVRATCNKRYKGKNQKIHGGSYIVFPADRRMDCESFTVQAFIFPTTPDKGAQGIVTKWLDSRGSGYGLFVDDDGCLACWIGDGKGKNVKVSSGKPLMRKVWYLAAAAYDAKAGRIRLYQQPVVTSANGGLGMSLLHPASDQNLVKQNRRKTTRRYSLLRRQKLPIQGDRSVVLTTKKRLSLFHCQNNVSLTTEKSTGLGCQTGYLEKTRSMPWHVVSRDVKRIYVVALSVRGIFMTTSPTTLPQLILLIRVRTG